MPKVKLISYSQGVNQEEPSEILAIAFSQCYQKPANIETVMRHLKHQSVLEHISFTFNIYISRVCWEQLVRHRIASYTAQSHRYTKVVKELGYIPSDLQKVLDDNNNLKQRFDQHLQETFDLYNDLVDAGVKKESARYIANKGTGIKATVTFNLRSLINMLGLRTEQYAQEEIQILAWEMWKKLNGILPNNLYQTIQGLFTNTK